MRNHAGFSLDSAHSCADKGSTCAIYWSDPSYQIVLSGRVSAQYFTPNSLWANSQAAHISAVAEAK